MLFYLEFVTDSPDSGQTPRLVIFDLLAKTFNMYIDCSGIADVFIAPDMIQKLFSCKYLIG
jgi:hypothetical protein